MPMSEIIFEVREDEVDGGITATALGYGIHTKATRSKSYERWLFRVTLCEETEITLRAELVKEFP